MRLDMCGAKHVGWEDASGVSVVMNMARWCVEGVVVSVVSIGCMSDRDWASWAGSMLVR